nr:Ribonuclease H protein [Ipomoea batatas]
MDKNDFKRLSAVSTSPNFYIIVECLRWAWQKRIRDLEVQSDTKNVIQWMRETSMVRGPLTHIISEARGWLNRAWRIDLRVIYREQNIVADRLASFGACQDGGRRILEVCPIIGEEVYFDDLAHVTWVRSVVEHT